MRLITVLVLLSFVFGSVFATVWYRDNDLDLYGNPLDSLEQTTQPDGYTTDNTDCDDNNALIHPGQYDIPCDGIDQNCDGIDDSDIDGDGYESIECGGYDCDDYDASIHPMATEICDGIDNNCDTYIDEGLSLVDYTTNTTQGYSPLTVDFTDISSGCPNPINAWYWEFGDGNTSLLQNPTHDYQSGKYTVSLTVTDTDNISSTKTNVDQITVFSTDMPASPTTVQIQASGDNAIINWSAVDTTFTGYPSDISSYLVYYSEIPDQDSLFFFHGFTSDTTYIHSGVVKFSNNMFYRVTSYVGDLKSLYDFTKEHPKFRQNELDAFINAKRRKQ